MQPEKQSPHTFIVRLWREKSEDSAFVWRGSVDHVQSGARAYFQSAARLVDVISQMVKELLSEKGEPGKTSASDENSENQTKGE